MPLELQRVTFTIPDTTVGRFSATRTVTFSGNVDFADVALNGWNLRWADGVNRSIVTCEADGDLVNPINGANVTVRAEAEFRDASGNDPYEGFITLLVIAFV